MLEPTDCLSCRKRTSVDEEAIHMTKWKFKSCPRCDGDMFIDRDLHGWFEQCLQCGYVRNSRNTVKSGQQSWSEKEEDRMVTTPSNE